MARFTNKQNKKEWIRTIIMEQSKADDVVEGTSHISAGLTTDALRSVPRGPTMKNKKLYRKWGSRPKKRPSGQL